MMKISFILKLIILKKILVDKKKKRGFKSFKYLTTAYYNKYDEEIKKISESKDLDKREKIINVWYKASLKFPIYDLDLCKINFSLFLDVIFAFKKSLYRFQLNENEDNKKQ